jgi:hypothetical protein
MFSTLRTRFGIPGIVSVIALVFAMTGGAFAAKYIITSTKQIKPSVLKSLQGKQGPAGTNGTNGTNGANGVKGDTGAPGGPGPNGKSVVTGDAGVECEEGGISVEVEGTPASKKFVCNGEEGPPGTNGSPWTAGGTLPPDATETGVWAIGDASPRRFGVPVTPISFAIPLKGKGEMVENPETELLEEVEVGLGETEVHYITKSGVVPAECNDDVAPVPSVFHPEADSGNLCVFESSKGTGTFSIHIENPLTGTTGAATSGAQLIASAPGEFFANGSFAVTGY